MALRLLQVVFLVSFFFVSSTTFAVTNAPLQLRFNDQLQNNEIQQAKSFALKLLSEDKNLSEAYTTLAHIAANEGDLPAAKDWLEKTFSLNPFYYNCYKNILEINKQIALLQYKKNFSTETKSSGSASLSLSLSPLNTEQAGLENYQNKIAELEQNNKSLQHKLASVEKLLIEAKKNRGSSAEPDNIENTITAIINKWHNAWSQKRLHEYFSFYIDNYHNSDSANHLSWKRERRDRIRAAKSISLKLSDLQFKKLSNKTYLVTFIQHYQSQKYQDTVLKQLTLSLFQGEWKIVQEQSEAL